MVEESLPACLQPIAWTCGSHHAVSQPALVPELQPHQPRRGSSSGSDTSSARVLMAISHTNRPHYGVQFHPESIATAFGNIVIDNFRQLTQQHVKTQSRRLAVPALSLDVDGHGTHPWFPSTVSAAATLLLFLNNLLYVGCADARRAQKQTQLDVAFRRMPEHLSNLGDSETLFSCLYSSRGAADTFWLDRWENLSHARLYSA